MFSLDKESSLRRGLSPDEVVQIGYDEIEPADIEMLQENLGLSDVAAQAAYNLERKFGEKKWLEEFLSQNRSDVLEMAAEIGVQFHALSALHNRLSRLKRVRFPGVDGTGGLGKPHPGTTGQRYARGAGVRALR